MNAQAVRIGQRVSINPHDGADLLGIVTELDRYDDGTPAAWVQYDDMRDGLTVKLPLSELVVMPGPLVRAPGVES